MGWYEELVDTPTEQPKKNNWYGETFQPAQPQQEAQPPEEKSIWQSTKDFFTGNDRQTESIKGLPEFDLPFEFSGRQAKTALGLLTTFDPKKQLKVWKENYPKLTFEEDEKGNIIADGKEYGAEKGVLNMPGVSGRDLLQAGFQVAAFTPAARAAKYATALPAKMAAVGAASGLTQTGQDLAGQYSGTADNVSLNNVDYGDVALATVGGGLGEGIFGAFAKAFPYLKNAPRTTITESMRDAFRKEALKAGYKASEVTDDVIKDFMAMSKQSVKPRNMPSTKNALESQRLSKEFNTQFTKGQMLDDIDQLNLEDSMRHGGLTDDAQRTMRGFDERQAQDITRASRDKVLDTFGGPGIEKLNDAGEIIRQGVQQGESVADQAVQSAYKNVGDAYLNPKNVSSILNKMKATTRNVDTLKDLKSTSEVLTDLKNMDELFKSNVPLRAYHVKQIEGFRRRLGGRISSAENATDRRQVQLMKNAFDEGVDDAITKSLFSGDDKAMENLIKARGLSRDYFKLYRQSDTIKKGVKVKDEAGAIIQKIVAGEPTNEQVVNFLFGQAKLAKPTSAKTIQRLKSILPQEQFNSLKEAAFLKLTGQETGAKKISGKIFKKKLDDAVNGSGETVMKSLFGKEDLALIKRFSLAVQKASPEIINPSKTSYKGSQIFRQWINQLGMRLGFLSGDPATMAAAKAATTGVDAIGNRLAKKAVNKSLNFNPLPRREFNAPLRGIGAPGLLEYNKPEYKGLLN